MTVVIVLTVASVACDRAQEAASRPRAVPPQPAEEVDAFRKTGDARTAPDRDASATTAETADDLTALADPAEKLVRRVRSSPFCRAEDVDVNAESTRKEWVPELKWAGDPDVGFVLGGVFCPPADPPPCTAELQIVDLQSDPAFLENLSGLCKDDWEWKCDEWQCVLDVVAGMEGVVHFVPRGDGAILAGSFQTPWAEYDDGTIDVDAHRLKWERKIDEAFASP